MTRRSFALNSGREREWVQKEVFPIADKLNFPSGKQADGVVFCRLLQRMGMMWFFVMLFLSDRGVSFGKYLTENVFLRFFCVEPDRGGGVPRWVGFLCFENRTPKLRQCGFLLRQRRGHRI